MEDGDRGQKLGHLERVQLHEPPEAGERWGFPSALKEAHAAALRDGANIVASAGVGAYPGRPPGPPPLTTASLINVQRLGRQSVRRRVSSDGAADELAGLPSSRGSGQRWVDLAPSSGRPSLPRQKGTERDDSPQALSRETLGGALVAARRASAGVRSPRLPLAKGLSSSNSQGRGGPSQHPPDSNADEDGDVERYIEYFAERNISSQLGPRGPRYVASPMDTSSDSLVEVPGWSVPRSACT